MTEQSGASSQAGTYSFAVTCYRRAPGDRGGWSSMASPELTAVEARTWIEQQAAQAQADGLQPPIRATEPVSAAGAGNELADTPAAGSGAPDALARFGELLS